MTDTVDIARDFHDAYERLAPEYAYETREASAVPWEDVPANNRALMVATVDAVVGPILHERDEALERVRVWFAMDGSVARIEAAVAIAGDYLGCDGGHHKQWALEEILRTLLGDEFEKWAAEWRDGEDGPDTYSWDEGVPA